MLKQRLGALARAYLDRWLALQTGYRPTRRPPPPARHGFVLIRGARVEKSPPSITMAEDVAS